MNKGRIVPKGYEAAQVTTKRQGSRFSRKSANRSIFAK